MKAKLPGLGGLKGLALAHGEKVVIALVAACVGYMVFVSLGRETLSDDKQADDLTNVINDVDNQIRQFTWDEAVKEFPDKVKFATPLEQKGDNFVDASKYLDPSWLQRGRNPPVVPPVVRRSDPTMLAATDLEATGSSGLLAFTNDDIRRERALAATRKAQQAAAEQQKRQDAQARESERGGRGRGEEDEPIDREHPNRRPVSGMGATLGVELAGDEEVRVAYWALVTAKIPIKEQIKLYENAFVNALGYSPQADFPQYLGYMVQRAEVLPNTDDANLKWVDVPVQNGKGQSFGKVVTLKALYGTGEQGATGQNLVRTPGSAGVTTDWAANTPEIVDPRFLNPSGILTFPLPPLVGRNFGREASHSDIPLVEDAVVLDAETAPVAADDAAPKDAEDEDVFGGAMGGPGGRQPGFGGGRGFGGPMRGGDMRGGEMIDRGFGGPMGGGGRAGMGGMSGDGAPLVSDWLLRFFDFSVQPGKKYKYRARLALLDPNQSFGSRLVSVDWLDKDAINRVRAERAKRGGKPARTPVLMTEWSEPSRTVSIPLAGSVHVASTKPAVDTSFTDEPRTTLLVQSFSADDRGQPTQGGEKFEFRRGYVANRNADVEALIRDEEGVQWIDKLKDFPLRSGITVVDIRGGERLPGRDNTRPGKVLLMDPAGQLFVQNELADQEAVELHEAIFAEDAEGRGGVMGGRGIEGMRGDMMRGGPGMGRGGR